MFKFPCFVSIHRFRQSPLARSSVAPSCCVLQSDGSSYGPVAMAQLQQRSTMHMHQQALRASSRIGRSVRTVQVFASSSNGGQKPVMLEVTDLQAKIVETGQQILNGVSLCVREGEVHAIMGKNGSGKSTLSKVLVGHPDYEVTGGSATYKGKNLFDLEPEERSHEGLFLSFQSPIEIPGVSNVDFLRMACNARRKSLGQTELDPLEFYAFVIPKLELLKMDPTFLNRNVNQGFSGGEKKRNEILQLAVLEAEMAILDEIDSGLDIDALRDVATAVNGLKTPERSVLMVTHYRRLLDYIKPDFVHIMEAGRISTTGGMELVDTLESGGYAMLKTA